MNNPRCILSICGLLALGAIPTAAQSAKTAAAQPDESTAIIRRLAGQGTAAFQVVLGDMYFDGDGAPHDYAEAARLYVKAAGPANTNGQHNLGLMHHEGQGVPQDYDEAAKWYPITEGHTLVVPHRHVAGLYDLAAADQAVLHSLFAEVRTLLIRRYGITDFNIGIKDGVAAGQTVLHAHIHVIPRRRGDVADPTPYWSFSYGSATRS